MKKKSKVVVIGLIENEDGEFLICQRHEPHLPEVHHKWDLPGGTNEDGESLEETLKREIIEETGLEVDIKSCLPESVSKVWKYSDHDQHTLVHCYHCVMISGDLHLDDHKINDLRWVSREKLADFEFLPTTFNFIKTLQQK